MPAHHTLEAYLDTYIDATGLRDNSKIPLFHSTVGRTGMLIEQAMHRIDAYRMIQRRAAAMGLKTRINCHTFRATRITASIDAGGTLENAQRMAAHESPRTTKPYDHTGDAIPLDEVERMRSKGTASGFPCAAHDNQASAVRVFEHAPWQLISHFVRRS